MALTDREKFAKEAKEKKERKEQAEQKSALLDEAYKGLFDSPGGQLVLQDLKTKFKYGKSVFNADARLNDYNQGAQATVIYIVNRSEQ